MEVKQVDLSIFPDITKDLRYLAIAGYPFEVCGTIHEYGVIHNCQNVFCGDKRHGFDMEVDIEDKSIVAIWHSHLNGLVEPSKDDLLGMELMATHGLVFPWVIATPKCVTAWQYLQTC